MLHTYQPISHRSLLAPALGMLGFCAALLAAPTAHAQVIATTPKIEAEAPTNTLTGTGIVIASTISGFSGTGYVDYNGKPTSMTIPYTATTAGYYDIVIGYESQYGFKFGSLSVNGSPDSPIYYNATAPSSGSTPNFRKTTARRILLNAGANTLLFSDNYGYYGIDYIQLAPSAANVALVPAATTGRVEAEAGQLFAVQSVVKDGDTSPYSGTSYVTSFSENKAANSSITLPITVATAGLYQLAVGARATDTGGKSFDLAVGSGMAAATSKLTVSLGSTASTTFAPFIVGKYNLMAGANTIVITSQTSYIDIDYVDITATTGVATAAKASAEAQKALTAYPNPTNGQALNVSLDLAAAQQTTFDLVNTMGQRVSSSTRSLRAGTNQLQVPTSGVASGIYQLVVRSGDQPALVQRVVIN